MEPSGSRGGGTQSMSGKHGGTVCVPQGMWDRGRNGKKEKKKTQLVLVEQVSRVVAGVGDRNRNQV